MFIKSQLFTRDLRKECFWWGGERKSCWKNNNKFCFCYFVKLDQTGINDILSFPFPIFYRTAIAASALILNATLSSFLIIFYDEKNNWAAPSSKSVSPLNRASSSSLGERGFPPSPWNFSFPCEFLSSCARRMLLLGYEGCTRLKVCAFFLLERSGRRSVGIRVYWAKWDRWD